MQPGDQNIVSLLRRKHCNILRRQAIQRPGLKQFDLR